MKSRIANCLRGLAILAGLASGCSTPNAVPNTHPVFSEVPLLPAKPAPQAHSDPQSASETVRQKALAAYATTYLLGSDLSGDARLLVSS
jgi:hypothetical protein